MKTFIKKFFFAMSKVGDEILGWTLIAIILGLGFSLGADVYKFLMETFK